MRDKISKILELEEKISSLENKLNQKLLIEDELKLASKKALEREKNIQDIIANFESFFNTTDDFLFVLDLNGKIIHCNKTVELRLGFTLDELIGLSVLDLHPKDKRDEAAQIVSDMINGKVDFCPISLVTKKGDYISVETAVKKGFWNGKPALFGVSKDISKLKLSEEKFAAAFYLNPSACGLSDATSGKYVEVNDAFCKLFGYNREEAIGHTAIELKIMSEKTREEILSGADSKGKIYNVEAELTTKNGEIKKVILSGQNINIQEAVYRYTVVHDVTEINQAMKQTEESENKFKNLYESLFFAYLIIKDGVCIDCNEAAVNIYDAENKDDIIGKSPTDYSPEFQMNNERSEDIAKRQIEIAIEKGFHTFEWLAMKKNKEQFFAEVSLKKYYHNNELYIQCLTHDITERKKIESDLIAAKEKAEESDRLKTAFLHNISHEVRTPLNAIVGFSSLLNEPDITEEKRATFSKIILNSSDQLVSIVNDILTISSLEAKQVNVSISPVSINNIIIELLTIFKQQSVNLNISLFAKQQLNNQQSEIYTDKTKVTQILTNLLSNALKFTHEGSIEFGYSLIENQLEFYVKDTGIGIDKEFHEMIFERFRQADKSINKIYGGTGLGLAISKALTELLGGKIRVESEIGKGSTFYFTIPYNPVHSIDQITSPTKQNANNKTILVAEDEEFNYLYIEELLIDQKIKLIHTKDGQETVDIFKSNPDIDLILMDIKMPIMNGYEAAKIIKSINPEIPIIAQSAYALADEKAMYQEMFDAYITKPIYKELLKQILAQYLGE